MTTERQPTPAGQRYLRELTDLYYIEPVIAQVFTEMQNYNNSFKQTPVSAVELQEIVTALDAKWDEFMYKQGTLTGNAAFQPEKQSPDAPVLQRDYYDNDEVTFEGVWPMQVFAENGDPLYPELQVRLKREAIVYDEYETSIQTILGFARPDDIISLEFPQVMSSTRAQHWLEHYHADKIDDINTTLLNTDSDECAVVRGLTGIVVDIKTPHGSDPELMSRSVQALDIYTNDFISFDQDMPYGVCITGNIWRDAGDNEFEMIELPCAIDVPARVSGVVWRPAFEGGNYAICAYLNMQIYTPDKNTAPEHLLVPMDSIEYIESLRKQYFASTED